MERFIKLHLARTGDEYWLRVGSIDRLRLKGHQSAIYGAHVDDTGVLVTETPAEILSMIEGRSTMPTVDEDGCCDVCGRDVHGCAACSGYVDPEDIRETRGGEKP